MGSIDHGRRDDDVRARVAETFRLEYGRVVASVLRIVRDVDAAEEIVQDAFAQALDRWPAEGMPDRPGAWLSTTARRRALDRLRHTRRAEARAGALAYEAAIDGRDEGPDVIDPHEIPDDRLRLIFTCCHPALPSDSRVALTLKLVGGLSTGEIARAFLVPEPTIAQRLVRAKRTIRDRALPYEVPEGAELDARLPAVLAVIYLIFNEGYAAHTGDALVRHDLCEEAIRLGQILLELMPSILLVEVSDATLMRDRRKGGLYARAGVRDYWIVNLIDDVLEVFRRPVRSRGSRFGGSYAETHVFRRGDVVTPLAAPDARVGVEELLP